MGGRGTGKAPSIRPRSGPLRRVNVRDLASRQHTARQGERRSAADSAERRRWVEERVRRGVRSARAKGFAGSGLTADGRDATGGAAVVSEGKALHLLALAGGRARSCEAQQSRVFGGEGAGRLDAQAVGARTFGQALGRRAVRVGLAGQHPTVDGVDREGAGSCRPDVANSQIPRGPMDRVPGLRTVGARRAGMSTGVLDRAFAGLACGVKGPAFGVGEGELQGLLASRQPEHPGGGSQDHPRAARAEPASMSVHGGTVAWIRGAFDRSGLEANRSCLCRRPSAPTLSHHQR